MRHRKSLSEPWEEIYFAIERDKISRWKNLNLNAYDVSLTKLKADEIEMQKYYRDYELKMSAFNALDFDDLILLPALKFKENPHFHGQKNKEPSISTMKTPFS